MILTPKVRKTLDIATQLIIAIAALSYIFYRVFSLPAGQVNTFINSVAGGKEIPAISTSLILFMFINWGIESFKWKLLIAQSEEVSFTKAYQAILGGLAVSVFTPNRIGEFFGRVFILKKTEPLKAILLTVVGSFSQLLVTIVFGTLAYLFFAPQYFPAVMNDSLWLVSGFSLTLAVASIVLMVLFFNVSVLHRITILVPSKYAEKIKNSIEAIADCPKRLLMKTFFLSMIRYLVFSTQFYLAIRLMGFSFTVLQCMLVIPVIYLVLAAIPTVALTEIGVRGSVAVFLFGLLSGVNGLSADGTLAVISATTLIWLLNIAVPSLAGVLVIFRLKFFGR